MTFLGGVVLNLFRKKSIHELLRVSKGGNTLKRDLSAWDLTLLGIGCIIGTGIFVLTGVGAMQAGPGLVISFIIAALVCGLTAMSYAEFASIVPISGSVYTYSYVTLGEFIAWIIGWDLVLEYLFAAGTVAAGWSGYFQSLLSGFNIHFPTLLTAAPGAKDGVHTIFNLPAFVIIMGITFLLSRGISQSKRVNNIMVIIKLLVVILFIAAGMWYVKPEQWHPFTPFGWDGVFNAAALVFFAYIGFDAVATAAEETRNPARDLPRGLFLSLGICTVLYILVTLVVVGIVPLNMFSDNLDHPVSLALQIAGQNWMAGLIDLGAILGMTTVILVLMYGQTRVFFSMSRDGLLPRAFSSIHPRYRTPYKMTWMLGAIAGMIGGLVPLNRLAELVNIGTLSAFILVSIGVIVLRKTQPDLRRAYRCPGVPAVPILGIMSCLFLMSQLELITWVAFLIWISIGVVVYFLYSRKNSLLNSEKK